MFLQIYKILSNFNYNPLIFDPNLFPGKNSPNIAKSDRVFPERVEEIEPWFWHIWMAQWLKLFPATAYRFRFRPSSGGNGRSKSDQKCKLWVRLFFMKTRILYSFLNNLFVARVLPLVRILTILNHIWGSKSPKTSQKCHFMDAESVRKTLKTFNLTSTNAIMMKLSTTMCLQGGINRKPLRAKNSVFWRNIYEFLD